MKRSINIKQFLLASLLPLGLGIYPVLNSYALNVSILRISNIWGALLIMALSALVIFLLTGMFIRKNSFQTAVASFPFLILFLNYGSIYNILIKWDALRIYHFNLLPVLIVFGIYLIHVISQIRIESHRKIWLVLISVVGFMLIFSLLTIIPAEFRKYKQEQENKQRSESLNQDTSKTEYPDIYWLIFDEFAGFDSIRDYFNYSEVDEFVSNLESIGFDVIEGSHSSTQHTLQEIATRLNYSIVNPDLDRVSYYELISNNKVMEILKDYGYTTVILDEPRSFSFGFPGKTKITADIHLDEVIGTEPVKMISLTNSFPMMVIKRTMLSPWTAAYELDDEEITRHQKAIYYVAYELGKLDTKSPKFVYTHLMFPHEPIIFAADGTLLDLEQLQNWDNYLGQYKFSISIIETTLKNILSNTDANNPPIIILQSDHGARNNNVNGKITLPDYPPEYNTSIMYALYAPMCPNMPIKDGIDPVNTFPLIFNCLFDMDIPLQ